MSFSIDPVYIDIDESAGLEYRYFLSSVDGGAGPKGYWGGLSIMRETWALNHESGEFEKAGTDFRRFTSVSGWYDVSVVDAKEEEPIKTRPSVPDDLEYPAQAYLDEWYERQNGRGMTYICGTIYCDSKGRFNDGVGVRTSWVKQLDREKRLAYTRNTVYQLGQEKGKAGAAPNVYDDIPSDVEPGEEKVVAEIKWPSVEMAGGHPLGAIHYGNDQVDLDRIRRNGPQGLMQEPKE
jgi:hypothetical protein